MKTKKINPALEKIQNNRNQVFNYLQTFSGTASRIKRIFDYHYDAIQREILQELAPQTKNFPSSNLTIDFLIEYMEEVMNWPDPELTQEEFNKLIANIDQEED